MKFRGISAPLKIRGGFYKINLKNIPLAIFTKGALIPTKFFLRKIDRFVLKKSTDHLRETVLFFRQACLLKFASLLSKIIYQKNLYNSSLSKM